MSTTCACASFWGGFLDGSPAVLAHANDFCDLFGVYHVQCQSGVTAAVCGNEVSTGVFECACGASRLFCAGNYICNVATSKCVAAVDVPDCSTIADSVTSKIEIIAEPGCQIGLIVCSAGN